MFLILCDEAQDDRVQRLLQSCRTELRGEWGTETPFVMQILGHAEPGVLASLVFVRLEWRWWFVPKSNRISCYRKSKQKNF